eukprot:gene1230-714_t
MLMINNYNLVNIVNLNNLLYIKINCSKNYLGTSSFSSFQENMAKFGAAIQKKGAHFTPPIPKPKRQIHEESLGRAAKLWAAIEPREIHDDSLRWPLTIAKARPNQRDVGPALGELLKKISKTPQEGARKKRPTNYYLLFVGAVYGAGERWRWKGANQSASCLSRQQSPWLFPSGDRFALGATKKMKPCHQTLIQRMLMILSQSSDIDYHIHTVSNFHFYLVSQLLSNFLEDFKMKEIYYTTISIYKYIYIYI